MIAVIGGLSAAVVVLGLLAALRWHRRLVVVTVRGPSMEPTYRDGDRVLVRRGPPARHGQVVVVERFRHGTPGGRPPLRGTDWIIKRVAACPGDPVPRSAVPALADRPEDRVPAGKLVLLGDNGAASIDSRQLGYFPRERTLGTVVRVLDSPGAALSGR